MKGGPAGEIIWLTSAIEWPSRLIGRPVVCVVIGSDALWSEIVPLEVDELTANLRAGQVEEVPCRLHLHLRKCTVEPHECVLLNIIGRFPSPQGWIVAEHLPGQPKQPVVGMLQKPLARTLLTLPHFCDQLLKLPISRETRGHGSPSGEGKHSQSTSLTPRVTVSFGECENRPQLGPRAESIRCGPLSRWLTQLLLDKPTRGWSAR